jgi:hypothetical protein
VYHDIPLCGRDDRVCFWLHMLAQASNDVLAGGDGLGIVIGILLIILIVIVILKVTGHSVIVKL